MAAKKTSSRTRLVNWLSSGKSITPNGAVNKFGFKHTNSFYATISQLRDKYDIVTRETPRGNAYYMA